MKSALRTIREKCLDCSANSAQEVRLCQVFDCPLWVYRMGKRPKTILARRPELLDPEKVREMGCKTANQS